MQGLRFEDEALQLCHTHSHPPHPPLALIDWAICCCYRLIVCLTATGLGSTEAARECEAAAF